MKKLKLLTPTPIVFLILIIGITFITTQKSSAQKPHLEYIKLDTIASGELKIDKNNFIYSVNLQWWFGNVSQWYVTKMSPTNDIIWRKLVLTSPDNWANDFVLDDTSNIYITGYEENPSQRAVTMKVDSSGNVKWIKTEATPGYSQVTGRKIELDKDGNVYVGGSNWRFALDYDIFLLKYNNAGEKIWHKIYNTSFFGTNDHNGFNTMGMDDFGNIYISGGLSSSTGNPPGSQFNFLKYDSSGNLLFSKFYTNFYSGGANCLSIINNKYVYLAGTVQEINQSSLTKILVMKYDSSGTQIWERRFTKDTIYENRPQKILYDSSKNIYVAGWCRNTGPVTPKGDYILLKYNQSGDLIWSRFKTGDTLGVGGDLMDLALDKYSNIYLGGTMCFRNTGWDIVTVKYDSSGSENWTVKYSYADSSFDSFGFIYLYPNNDFLIAAGFSIIDKVAFMRYSQTVGITSLSNSVPDKFDLFQNYPNPFNSQTKIKFNISKKDNYKLRIFDMLGREIFQITYTGLEPGIYEYLFNMNNFSSGSYFYEFSSNKEKIVKQMLLIK